MIASPQPGDTRINKYRMKQVWAICPDCGKGRWIYVNYASKRCIKCHCKNVSQPIACHSKHPNQAKSQEGSGNHQWKGGKKVDNHGYVLTCISRDDPYYPMTHKSSNYILEHRLVMARHLGRCLLPTEHIHHKDGDKSNNRIENLELISQADHNIYKQICAHCQLRKEVKLLKWQIKQLQLQLQTKLALKSPEI